jgi:hypothetical protein
LDDLDSGLDREMKELWIRGVFASDPKLPGINAIRARLRGRHRRGA